MKLGVLSLGNTAADPVSGHAASTTERFAEVLRLGELAEESGLDYFGFGEHHAGRTVASAPPVVLAAVAARTQRIGLISTVTLLSTLDPVRVAEDYATVDQISRGRAELIIGKGNSADPYPLFGYDREHQWELLAEHHGLLRRLWRDEPVTFTGRFRGPLREVTTLPRPTRVPPIWHGVATSLRSPELAARHGEPIFVANAIEPLENYASLVDHYRRVWAEQGHDPVAARVGCGGQLYVGRSSQAARSELRPYYEALWSDRDPTRDRGGIGDEPAGTTVEDHIRDGGLFTGSPAEIIDKVGRYHERLGQDTMIFGVEVGGLPHAMVADSLHRFAEEVAPALRAL